MELISIVNASKKYGKTTASISCLLKRGKIKRIGKKVCLSSFLDYYEGISIKKLPNEIWKQIPNFRRYYASNLGRIKSIKHRGGNEERLINTCISGGYYKSVFLNDNGEYKSINAHRLICLAFHPIENYENLEVNHKDGNKLNNNIDNLEWCSRKQNIEHSIINGLQKAFKGEEVGNSKLKEYQVTEIREKFKPYVYTRKMLAIEYQISEATIKDIVNRKTWNHI